MVIAGIVLYNPDISRLKENVGSIAPQVDAIVFVDNGSSNKEELEKYIKSVVTTTYIIWNYKNLGIAKALNLIMDKGNEIGASWVLTLDQDSVSPINLVASLIKYTSVKEVGVVCPLIHDRSFGVLADIESKPYKFIDTCITSASLTNVQAWRKVGGFDDVMFIDGVDTDFCYSLKKAGYKILQTSDVELLHEIGHDSKVVSLFGHKQVVFNHSAFRYYHICRNVIYKQRKHREYLPSPYRGLITNFYRWLLIMIYEKNKWDKTKSIIKGTYDGFIMPINYKNYIR